VLKPIVHFDKEKDIWLGIDTKQDFDTSKNPLMNKERFFDEHPGTRQAYLLRDPEYITYATYFMLGITLPPFQAVIQREIFNHAFPMFIGGRGIGKSFSLALYSILACALNPDHKIVIAGATFRQSKFIYEYCEKIINDSPMLRSMFKIRTSKNVDVWKLYIDGASITAIPIGHSGDKVRGLRANDVIIDEMAAHTPQIIEEVLFGFAAIGTNPVMSMIEEMRLQYRKSLVSDEVAELLETTTKKKQNKCIISGTAEYYFNHFYDYWMKYKKIVESCGDKNKLSEIFGGEVPDVFDWRDYCVIRMPYSMLPPGFMDDKVIARAKAQMTKALYLKEYEAVFVEDSDGFFKRSLIENCVANEKNISQYNWVTYCPATFEPVMYGSQTTSYVYGIDPAAKDDNFAVIILEIHQDHARIVYCWTTNEADYLARKRQGFTSIDNYYSFCARKIHDLRAVFPTTCIGIDTQGGGYALIEAMKSIDNITPGESPLYPVINKEKPQDTDRLDGSHVLHLIQFANATWMSEANWGLKKDLETRKLLFPNFDALTVDLSIAQDKIRVEKFKKDNPSREIVLYDSLEDCAIEIEDLKDELTNIMYSRTTAGRERWDVPEVQIDKNKKGSGKKDRYSALIIANSLVRLERNKIEVPIQYGAVGALAKDAYNNSEKYKKAAMYASAPNWFLKK